MIILYPTETLYALGVNALHQQSVRELYALKSRDGTKPASWLVRHLEDVEKYAEVGELGARIAERFLPGALTLVLRAKDIVPVWAQAEDGTVSFRIASDPIAQKIIAEHMAAYDTPLTCTSANVSGAPTLPTPSEILQQFAGKAQEITKIVDDGSRKSLATTIVRIVDDTVTILREGDISEQNILQCVKEMPS